MKKKADFGARTLVTIILTILGFVILLFFLFNLINIGKVDKEACHQSVILRGTTPETLESFVPLNCKTEKICITTKTFGGECEDFENSKGITYIRVNKKEQVEKAIAESLIDCWSMMGEGKLSLFHQFLADQYGVGDVYPSCVMCSRIAFDKIALAKSKIELSTVNVERYMATHAIGSDDISYLDYISGPNSAPLSISESLNFPDILGNKSNRTSAGIEILTEEEKKAEVERQKNEFNIQSDEIGILFMQVSAPKGGETLANIAKSSLFVGAAAGGTFGFRNTFGVVGRLGKFACTKGGPAIIACSAVALGAIFVQQANVAANRNIAAGVCSDVVMGDKARDGCSVVRAVNYDEESIGAYCLGIESSK